MKHVRALSRKPRLADIEDWPVDLEFIVDILSAILLKYSEKSSS